MYVFVLQVFTPDHVDGCLGPDGLPVPLPPSHPLPPAPAPVIQQQQQLQQQHIQALCSIKQGTMRLRLYQIQFITTFATLHTVMGLLQSFSY